MSQDIPSQELVARDLHGQDWKFRHIYRGNVLLLPVEILSSILLVPTESFKYMVNSLMRLAVLG